MVRDDSVSIMKDIDTEVALEHCVDGLRLLLSQPEFAETRRAKEVVEILEERVLLRSILSEAPDEGSMGVFIGEENPKEALRPFSVIMSQYGIPQEASGTISVIGPTRMEYASAIGGVRFLSSFMSELIMSVHGKL
jgi:heat-inducible transcriptional repressor